MTEEIRWKRTHCSRMDHGDAAFLSLCEGIRLLRSKEILKGF